MQLSKPRQSFLTVAVWIGVFVIGAILGGLALRFFFPGAAEDGDKATSRASYVPTHVTALGRIEPEHGVLTLGVSIPDRILSFFPKIHPGAEVKKGEELVKLESYDARELEWKMMKQQQADALARRDAIQKKANAQLDLDELRMRQAEDTSDIKLQEGQVAFSKRKAQTVRDDLARVAFNGSTVSKQEIEHQQLQVLLADHELTMAQGNLDKLKKARKLNLDTAKAQKLATQAELTNALSELSVPTLQAKTALARVKLQESILHAPSDGTILKIFARPGELVGGQQPILQMADTSRMVVVAEVYETDIRRVQEGQEASITGRALPSGQELRGKVIQIGAMVGPNRVRDIDPTADVNRRVIDVKVLLDKNTAAGRLINHQVIVKILVASGS